MEDNKKSYYAIIPANVRYDKELTPNAKLLYGEITALCNEKGYCWASNEYFAGLYSVSKQSISSWVSLLAKKNYIKTTIQYKENSKEILSRYIRIFEYPMQENLNTPIQENLKDNTTVNNNTFNKDIVPYKEIIEYLNLKAKSNYKYEVDKTKELIKARWNEKFTLEDFKTVIDTKVKEWGQVAIDTQKDMGMYLRPLTLFSNKFEGYLNQTSKKETEIPNSWGKVRRFD